MSHTYYNREDFILIDSCLSCKDLYEVAEKVLDRIPPPICQVCGPISTGGKGNVGQNIEEFQNAIKYLESKEKNVWSQMPLEGKMVAFWKKWKENNGEEYFFELLDDFYLPIFESGKINEMWFIYGWQSSFGANWERKQAERLGIKIFDLPENFN